MLYAAVGRDHRRGRRVATRIIRPAHDPRPASEAKGLAQTRRRRAERRPAAPFLIEPTQPTREMRLAQRADTVALVGGGRAVGGALDDLVIQK